MRLSLPVVLAAALVAASGCSDGRTGARAPAAPPGSQIYMKDGVETVLTPDLLMRDGKVFLENGAWTNLSSVVEKLEPSRIEYLNLDRNAFTNVDCLAAFTSLKWLRLNGNRLETLPDLRKARNMKRIYLAGNRFKEVPRGIEGLKKLTDIDLSGNPISSIPEWLATRHGFEHLSFNGTRIKKLPDDLRPWRSLKSLQLGDIEAMDEAELRRVRAELPGTAVVF